MKENSIKKLGERFKEFDMSLEGFKSGLDAALSLKASNTESNANAITGL